MQLSITITTNTGRHRNVAGRMQNKNPPPPVSHTAVFGRSFAPDGEMGPYPLSTADGEMGPYPLSNDGEMGPYPLSNDGEMGPYPLSGDGEMGPYPLSDSTNLLGTAGVGVGQYGGSAASVHRNYGSSGYATTSMSQQQQQQRQQPQQHQQQQQQYHQQHSNYGQPCNYYASNGSFGGGGGGGCDGQDSHYGSRSSNYACTYYADGGAPYTNAAHTSRTVLHAPLNTQQQQQLRRSSSSINAPPGHTSAASTGRRRDSERLTLAGSHVASTARGSQPLMRGSDGGGGCGSGYLVAAGSRCESPLAAISSHRNSQRQLRTEQLQQRWRRAARSCQGLLDEGGGGGAREDVGACGSGSVGGGLHGGRMADVCASAMLASRCASASAVVRHSTTTTHPYHQHHHHGSQVAVSAAGSPVPVRRRGGAGGGGRRRNEDSFRRHSAHGRITSPSREGIEMDMGRVFATHTCNIAPRPPPNHPQNPQSDTSPSSNSPTAITTTTTTAITNHFPNQKLSPINRLISAKPNRDRQNHITQAPLTNHIRRHRDNSNHHHH